MRRAPSWFQLRISAGARRSLPPEGTAAGFHPSRSHRAAALIVGALVLLAAFVVVVPYLSSALKQGYSIISGSTAGLSTVSATMGQSTSTNGSSASTNGSENGCSSTVTVQNLAAPDINNGTADIAYPSDYCTLASYALGLINQDRAANGTGSVTLDYNRAAQQHADSMLYYGYFSHYDVQGYKPYMRYSLLGGAGADFENVAYYFYSLPHFLSTTSVESAIQALEHSMVYNDSSCCSNGHRYNILDPLHNKVSIGVAYNGNYVYFDEEFENVYLDLNFTATGASAYTPYHITMKGTEAQTVTAPNSIYIAYDSPPAAMTPTQLSNGPHEYDPGTLIGGVTPRDFFGECPQFSSGTTVCADTWTFDSTTIDIAFPLQPFIKEYGAGVYTIYLITGASTESAITSISVIVPS
jgi:uncharacterized protein YkwD